MEFPDINVLSIRIRDKRGFVCVDCFHPKYLNDPNHLDHIKILKNIECDILGRPELAFKIKVYSSLIQNWSIYIYQVTLHCVNMVKEFLQKGYRPRDIMILSRNLGESHLKYQLKDSARKLNVPISTEAKRIDQIPLLTIHKSKGLQARVVFILRVDKGAYGLPSELENPDIFAPAKIGKEKGREEEERRLFYVAVTRAKEEVIIYCQKSKQSKFLDEIRENVIFENLHSNDFIESY